MHPTTLELVISVLLKAKKKVVDGLLEYPKVWNKGMPSLGSMIEQLWSGSYSRGR